MIGLILGILIALILWKLLKLTFKFLLFLIPVGLICFFVFPNIFLVLGFGLLASGLIGTLILIGLIGFIVSLFR